MKSAPQYKVSILKKTMLRGILISHSWADWLSVGTGQIRTRIKSATKKPSPATCGDKATGRVRRRGREKRGKRRYCAYFEHWEKCSECRDKCSDDWRVAKNPKRAYLTNSIFENSTIYQIIIMIPTSKATSTVKNRRDGLKEEVNSYSPSTLSRGRRL